MTKEKLIEKSIINYLRSIGAWVEGLQAGTVMIKKGSYTNRMNLCTNGTPDIICLYNGTLYAIEVKKNEKEVKDWLKKEQRYNETGELPKSYEREKNQIKHKNKITEQGGVHLLTDSLDDVIDYFTELQNKLVK